MDNEFADCNFFAKVFVLGHTAFDGVPQSFWHRVSKLRFGLDLDLGTESQKSTTQVLLESILRIRNQVLGSEVH